MSKFTEWTSKTDYKFKLRQWFLLFWTFENGSGDVASPDLMRVGRARRSETGQEYLLIFGITKRVDVFLEIMQTSWNESVKWYHFRKWGSLPPPHWWIRSERLTGIAAAAAFINTSLGLTTTPELCIGVTKHRIFLLCAWADNGWKRWNEHRPSRRSCQAPRGTREGNV